MSQMPKAVTVCVPEELWPKDCSPMEVLQKIEELVGKHIRSKDPKEDEGKIPDAPWVRVTLSSGVEKEGIFSSLSLQNLTLGTCSFVQQFDHPYHPTGKVIVIDVTNVVVVEFVFPKYQSTEERFPVAPVPKRFPGR